MKPQRIDGQLIDIEPAVKRFQFYTVDQRATKMSSPRQGFRQRNAVGEAFWTHPLCPGVCFSTRAAALRAALRTRSHG